MAARIKLDIVTPDRMVYSANVSMVIARTQTGDLKIFPGHALLVTSLEVTSVRIVREKSRQQLSLCGAFMEIRKKKITILASYAEIQAKLDGKQTKTAKMRKELQLKGSADIDTRRARIYTYRAALNPEVTQQKKSVISKKYP
ncbi:ATP synthase F1 subunit epsilon [Sporomusa aerivorans]|uniref:ATP synthase F1 subunit epsilon n=1 Tax=Sporomusa aerivorans TaxID=204936 RepID=UPI00352BAE16